MIEHTFLSIFLIAAFNISLAQPKAISVEPGVSLQLSKYRKANISDIKYELRFEVPAARSEAIGAQETLSFQATSNLYPLQIDLKQDAGKVHWVKVNGKKVPVNLQHEHLLIDPHDYRKGSNIVEVSFIAGDRSLNRNDELLYALFVPDHARSVFPCFDQPDLKARFKLDLTVPKGWKALSNGKTIDSATTNDRTTYAFAESDLLPTYLFSFTAGKYTTVRKMLGKRPADLLYRETDPKKIQLSVDSIFGQHQSAINFLEGWTGVRYPFQKLGFVAVPDFQFGGMEHPGEVQYKASSLFLDDAATKNMRLARINLISHETAHMWFGDLVTMRWFNDVWMKEVFANLMADKVTQKLMGNQTFDLKFLQDHYPAAYNVDRTAGANPIRQELGNLQDAGSMYGDIIYHKAPIMMRQLEMLMGKDNFQAGVREYLKKYAYQNATWPDLISILSKHTKEDLAEWNKVWVNQTGRPIINAQVRYDGDRISEFMLTQRPEKGNDKVWPQSFEVMLIYPDHEQRLMVNMNGKTTRLDAVNGLPKPSHILYNSNGNGYGVFPIDESWTPDELYAIKDPLHRASFYINAYENMLNGKAYTPIQLLDLFQIGCAAEQEETNLRLLTGYMTGIYWEFLTPGLRDQRAEEFEKVLWNAFEKQSGANHKKLLFNAYLNVYRCKSAGERINEIWRSQQAPAGIKLTEDDYINMALTLAVKSDTATSVLQRQLSRMKDPDRKKRLEFLMPALSNNVQERDAFFNSLKQRKGREKEAWVSAALYYLHHPLRQATSIRYIPESLNLLEEIQATGDIFFPQSFLNATLRSYQSKQVADMVNAYIKAHPKLETKLLNKLLQGADDLFRAQQLTNAKRP
ncbi:M1 family aminopeptidase [Mucilaginibacter daejeonensis]|uniref:M1 family metallopeptidase n=1 Tax=Mucilaginibacter daejeonensis TaxID=398049 RepID=UPI001D173E85|nr:M1 family aminopeptidase [Mucilaginibacter daejeonensis]UEG55009.1 M1 family aminopeptidase [Mucilaginibacter daejeonensis]